MTANFLPYHGLWKAGKITLPNGSQLAHPDPHTFTTEPSDFGSAALVKRPGWSAPARTPAEIAADVSAGRQWLGHALLAGSDQMLGGKKLFGFIYIDPAGKRWRVQTTSVHRPRPPGHAESDTCSIAVTFRRFGHFDRRTHGSVLLNAAAGSGVVLPVSTVWGPGDGTADLICAKSDGSEAIFGRTIFPSFWWGDGQLWPILFWRLTISGNGDETLPNFGLSIGWSIEFGEANYKFTNRTQDQTTNGIYRVEAWTKVDTGGGLMRVDVSNSGGHYYDRLTTRHSTQIVRLYPAYTAGDSLVWLQASYVWQETVSEVKVLEVIDGAAYAFQNGTGITQKDGAHRDVTTTTRDASYTATLTFGPATLYSVTRSAAQVVTVSNGATVADAVPLTYLSPPPTGLAVGSGSFNWTLGADPAPTDTTVISSFGQGTSPWGVGYPSAFGDDMAGKYRQRVAVRYSDQVIGLIELDVPAAGATFPVTRQQLVDAWAPSGAHVGFSATAPRAYPVGARWLGSSWDGRFCSWNPATDAIAVDTVPICWV